MRSNVTDWSAEDPWRAYIQLTEAEEALRIHKSDLDLRPLWHQKQSRVEAHILVCFLAYALWKTLAGMCRAAGLGGEPRKVFQELSTIALVDVVLTRQLGRALSRAGARCRQANFGRSPTIGRASRGGRPRRPTRQGIAIRKRCIGRPTAHQAILLQRLGLRLPSSLETVPM